MLFKLTGLGVKLIDEELYFLFDCALLCGHTSDNAARVQEWTHKANRVWISEVQPNQRSFTKMRDLAAHNESAVFIAKLASPPNKPLLKIFYFEYFGCQNGRFFVVFRLHRVHLDDSSIYFIDFWLLVEGDLRSVWGCFFLGKPRLHNTSGVFW